MNICILGRQPEIGLAELESLYGAQNVEPTENGCALVNAEIDFDRLGSSVKTGEVLMSVPTTNPQKLFFHCKKILPKMLRDLPEGKIKLGVSMIGYDMPVHKINANVLSLKKIIRSYDRSIRVIPNQSPVLSSAQTYHNQLTSPLGIEFVFVRHKDQSIIARTTHVQDIDAYRIRDRDRPKRDAFVGMLPPKLAQTIINLATGTATLSKETIVLDPFCGTGVVAIEASLMGSGTYSTDISKRMIDYTSRNLTWISEKNQLDVSQRIEIADARDHIWRQPVSCIASEGYLGQPIGGNAPEPAKLRRIIDECNTIARDFLRNIADQIQPDTRLCLALPVWYVNNKTHYLPLLDETEALGFSRISFVHSPGELIYRRDDQPVGRYLLTLSRP